MKQQLKIWSLDQIKEEIHEESWALIKEFQSHNINFEMGIYDKLKSYLPESFRIWNNTPDEIELN